MSELFGSAFTIGRYFLDDFSTDSSSLWITFMNPFQFGCWKPLSVFLISHLPIPAISICDILAFLNLIESIGFNLIALRPSNVFGMHLAIAFIPVDLFPNTFDDLKQHCPPELQSLFEYFENYRTNTIDHHLWNIHGIQLKTNNKLEAKSSNWEKHMLTLRIHKIDQRARGNGNFTIRN